MFASAPGIRKQDWSYLHDQIFAALPEAPVRSTRITPFGVTYEVIVDVDGLNVEGRRGSAPDVDVGEHPVSPCHNPTGMPATPHAVLDVVELVADSGRWPAGTIGTVVEADDEKALVEISDDRGHGVDFISVPHHVLSPAGEDIQRFAS